MTLGEFRSLTKDIDDDAEIYFDTIELRTGLLDLAILHNKHSIDLQEEVRGACRYLGKDAVFRYLEDCGLTKKEVEELLSEI